MDASYHCFMNGDSPQQPPKPSCVAQRGPVSLPRTNQIYAVNEDPANPLRCVPRPPGPPLKKPSSSA